MQGSKAPSSSLAECRTPLRKVLQSVLDFYDGGEVSVALTPHFECDCLFISSVQPHAVVQICVFLSNDLCAETSQSVTDRLELIGD